GEIDKTLFIKRHKDDILLVQVYVDDIIFGSTKKEKSDGIFIDQDKYVAEVLKKFDFVNVKTASTPMESNKPLIKDEEAEDVDVHLYRLMIGSLMYLTASRTDITFDVCARPSDYAGAGLDRKSATGAKDGSCFVDTSEVTTGFSGVITPLFDTMMVQAPTDMGDTPVETYQTPIVDQPSTSKPQKTQKSRRKQRKEAEISHDES
nr:hypothetical protein [Tanacetum cinerariifolium]